MLHLFIDVHFLCFFSLLLFLDSTTSLSYRLTYKGNSNIDGIGLWNDQKTHKILKHVIEF